MKILVRFYCLVLILVHFSVSGLEANPSAAKLKVLLQAYPAADANNDGVLSRDEAHAYRKKMMARLGMQQDTPKKRKLITPSETDIKYGSHTRNVLDFFKAKSKEPAPVLICFHGGGFVSGDKNKYQKDKLAAACIANGISVISANYRFVKGEDPHPFPAPMHDGARVVQFVRSKAEEWHIDPKRIALTGTSAGANMSMWIAMHDDLADPESTDPISKFSTRVNCVISKAGQTSNDPSWILKNIGGDPSIHASVLAGYGVTSSKELKSPKIRKLIDEASAINHATHDDPPMLLIYPGSPSNTLLSADTPIEVSIHHANFGKALKKVYEKLKLECHFHHAGHPAETKTETDFLLKHFGLKQLKK